MNTLGRVYVEAKAPPVFMLKEIAGLNAGSSPERQSADATSMRARTRS